MNFMESKRRVPFQNQDHDDPTGQPSNNGESMADQIYKTKNFVDKHVSRFTE